MGPRRDLGGCGLSSACRGADAGAGIRSTRAITAAQALFRTGSTEAASGLLRLPARLGPIDVRQRAQIERLRAPDRLRRGPRARTRRGRFCSTQPIVSRRSVTRLPERPTSRQSVRRSSLGVSAPVTASNSGRRGARCSSDTGAPCGHGPPSGRAHDAVHRGIRGFSAGIEAGAERVSAGSGRRAKTASCGGYGSLAQSRPSPSRQTFGRDDKHGWDSPPMPSSSPVSSAPCRFFPVALSYRAGVHVHMGEFAEAAELLAEADRIAGATRSTRLSYTGLVMRP